MKLIVNAARVLVFLLLQKLPNLRTDNMSDSIFRKLHRPLDSKIDLLEAWMQSAPEAQTRFDEMHGSDGYTVGSYCESYSDRADIVEILAFELGAPQDVMRKLGTIL